MLRRSSYLEECCALALVLLTAALVGTASARDIRLAAQAAPLQYAPIRIHIDPNNPPQHLVINLSPAGTGTVTMTSMPAQPSLPVVQAWTRALTDYYRGADGAAVAQARTALARLRGDTDEDRFMRAQIALVLVRAARRADEPAVARGGATVLAAQLRRILDDPHASPSDKRAARTLARDLPPTQR